MSSNRDATKKARGFNYQRQYAIYIFLKSIETDNIFIIEEGKIDDLTYEDITLIDNNNQLITYQIKYHSDIFNLIRSNKDFFKTINNNNNLLDKVKNIIFIISKNKNTFDDFFNDWKDKKISSEEIFNKIINLNINDNSEVEQYKKCYALFTNKPKEIIINYIDKIQIEEGLTYDELITEINNIIKNIFKIDDDIIIIYYIKYYIFDIFEKNWFNDNILLKINDYYSQLKIHLNNLLSNYNYNDNDDSKLFNNILNNIIIRIKNYIKSNDININNLYIELNNFLNNLYNKIDIKNCICLLILLHRIYINHNNDILIELYNNIKKQFIKCLIKKIGTDDNISYDKNMNIINSIQYYNNKHNIYNLLSISNPIFKEVLSNEELLSIKSIINF